MARLRQAFLIKLRRSDSFDPTRRPSTSFTFNNSEATASNQRFLFHLRYTDPGGNGAGWLQSCVQALRICQHYPYNSTEHGVGSNQMVIPTLT